MAGGLARSEFIRGATGGRPIVPMIRSGPPPPDVLESDQRRAGRHLTRGDNAMDLDEFRRHGHGLVDWMADYLAGVERYPVRAQVEPGAIAAQLPAAPPAAGEPLERIFADFERILLPGMTHWQHPGFFAYFPANSSPPSVLAEMLTATLGAQCMLWQTSPAATELETRVLDWLRQMIGLPEGFAGVIQDSASSATLCAVLVARERATDWRTDEQGLAGGPQLCFYTSEEAHSSIEKAIRIAGLGRQSLRLIATDAHFAMRPDALEAAIRADLANGLRPAGVLASLGTTGVGAIDPLKADRRALPGARALSPRRCRLGGQCLAARGAALDDARHRAGRQLRLQPAQMAAHQLRLLGAFRARP